MRPATVLVRRQRHGRRAAPALPRRGYGAVRRWSTTPVTPRRLFWTEAEPLSTAVDDVCARSPGPSPACGSHMTCLTGFFQDPRRQSLAVATLLHAEGGAWGTWGSTAMTYPGEHRAPEPGAGEGAPARREDARRGHAGRAGRDERSRGPVHLRAARRPERPRGRDAALAVSRRRSRPLPPGAARLPPGRARSRSSPSDSGGQPGVAGFEPWSDASKAEKTRRRAQVVLAPARTRR